MDIIQGTGPEVLTGPTNGWVVGHFGQGIAHSRDLEIKSWEHPVGLEYPLKEFPGTEFIQVFGGVLGLYLELPDGTIRECTLSGSEALRQYILLPPGTKKRVSVVGDSSAYGITVRWPSQP